MKDEPRNENESRHRKSLAGVARILIVDDHRLVSDTLAAALDKGSHFEFHTVQTVQEAMKAIGDSGEFDIILLDYKLPDAVGLDGLRTLLGANKGRVALFSGSVPTSMVQSALELGAQGFIPKSIKLTSLSHALELMLAGEIFVPGDLVAATSSNFVLDNGLTDRQRAVLELIYSGLGNKEIAHHLNVSTPLVASDIRVMCRKFEVRGRVQLVIEAEKRGII